MGFYEERVLPRAIDLMLGNKQMGKLRSRALEGISGTVLEVGFGSGTNLDYYPIEVNKVLAVEPSLEARSLARARLARTTIPVEFVGLSGESLDLATASVDNAVSTWTLCTIPDVAAALREIARVLRPGGRLYFLEHGLSDDHKVARRQHRFEPIQKRIAGGCHLTRDHRLLLGSAGFDIERVDTFQIAGPKITGYMYAGTAILSAATHRD